MKVLVTGAAGFIGSHVVDALVARGDNVLCIDSLDPGVHRTIPNYLNPAAEYCFSDLRMWRPDSRFMEVEGIVHLAALGGVSRAAAEPENIISANCGGTARLVAAAAAANRLHAVVVASSFSIYGAGYTYRCKSCGAVRDGSRNDEDLAAGRYDVLCAKCTGGTEIRPITVEATPAPLETYGASKYMQELCFRALPAVPVKVMRFSSVYGRRMRLEDGEATIIAKLAGAIRAGVRPTLFEDGRQMRDWIHVDDVIAATLALLDDPSGTPNVLNVCSGQGTTLQDACEALNAAMGAKIAPYIAGGYRSGDMRHCLGDASDLTRLLGRPPISFPDGVHRAFGCAGLAH